MRIVEVARGELGVTEATGKNDGIPAERYMRGDELPWCAGFCLWVHERAGVPVPGSYYPLRNVDRFELEMKERGIWLGRGVIPEAGDVVFFDTRGGSDAGRGRHVGIVERVDMKTKTVHTIEGNLGDRVARARHPLFSPRITGFARVSDWHVAA